MDKKNNTKVNAKVTQQQLCIFPHVKSAKTRRRRWCASERSFYCFIYLLFNFTWAKMWNAGRKSEKHTNQQLSIFCFRFLFDSSYIRLPNLHLIPLAMQFLFARKSNRMEMREIECFWITFKTVQKRLRQNQ